MTLVADKDTPILLPSSDRPTIDETMMEIAHTLAKRSTCKRRAVGCVLTNSRGQVLSTGYNGVARGQNHCLTHPCAGASMASGEGLDACEAIHAEQNALLQCPDVEQIAFCYTTTSPCVHCVKLLLNTTCHTIVFTQEYVQPQPSILWSPRTWVHIPDPRLKV